MNKPRRSRSRGAPDERSASGHTHGQIEALLDALRRARGPGAEPAAAAGPAPAGEVVPLAPRAPAIPVHGCDMWPRLAVALFGTVPAPEHLEGCIAALPAGENHLTRLAAQGTLAALGRTAQRRAERLQALLAVLLPRGGPTACLLGELQIPLLAEVIRRRGTVLPEHALWRCLACLLSPAMPPFERKRHCAAIRAGFLADQRLFADLAATLEDRYSPDGAAARVLERTLRQVLREAAEPSPPVRVQAAGAS